ncbi:putative bifunctional diguanylate cyclase/phosphodiesterase [Methylobacter sp. YRD-M1]|uniref:putative bifunctional diguanylate cyclase/phosphodiesterase n=1 Tax=Methylobacter sp. YRD-M1 TaxID=2911520 RepID=UPI00227A866D|nr:EAL domain-containing protein [Methylobacter sp. YRD-M1]WAK00502.1 EAL domain-containing protein [Methylobacter sp. YRD-M1]
MTLSDFIRTNSELIISRWEAFAKSIPVARYMDSSELRDHAKGILLTIATDLDHTQTSLEQREKSEGRASHEMEETEAREHGYARLSAEFSISETMSEFRALRASVMQLWTDSAMISSQIASDDIIRFNEAIDQAITESLERYSRLFDALLSSSPDLNYIIDIRGRIAYANKAMTRLFNMSQNEIVGKNYFDLGVTNAAEVHKVLQQVLDTRESHHGEMSLATSDETELIFEYIFAPVINADGYLDAIAGTARNITERKVSEKEAIRSANYDRLTGLANRTYFLEHLDQDIRRSERSGLPIALLFIDLDGFKSVNDREGHDAGDLLLQQVAQRIVGCVRGTDMVARLGGDEFTVILNDVNKVLRVEILAQEMLEDIAKPFSILGKDIHISASIGISLFPQDAATPGELIRNADQAMYVAKGAGRSRFSFFTVAMRDAAWAHLRMIDELRRAIPQNELAVYYQPIVDLADEKIVKAEALLRWHHPKLGLIRPNEFIGLAEETGLIVEIGEWVLNDAMKCAQEWSTLLGTPFQISVNKSSVEFIHKAPMKDWDIRLAALALPWNSLSIEITEEVLINESSTVRDKLDYLRRAGVQLSIDNFGMGYSSITSLKRLNVDFLKIDMSFVHDMLTSKDSCSIVEIIIMMAHKLGLKVIAEGVETVEQRDCLKAAECDYAQGYLFSEPVSSPDLEKLLKLGKALHPVQT